jgi:hypothetical protein
MIVLAKFVVSESAFKILSKDELKSLRIALRKASALLSSAPTCVQFLSIEQTIKRTLGGRPQTSAQMRETMREDYALSDT